MPYANRSARRMHARRIRWVCCILLFSGLWLGWNSLSRPALSLMAFAAGACVVYPRRANAASSVVRSPVHSYEPRVAPMPWAANIWQEVDAHRDILDMMRQRTRNAHRGMGCDGCDR